MLCRATILKKARAQSGTSMRKADEMSIQGALDVQGLNVKYADTMRTRTSPSSPCYVRATLCFVSTNIVVQRCGRGDIFGPTSKCKKQILNGKCGTCDLGPDEALSYFDYLFEVGLQDWEAPNEFFYLNVASKGGRALFNMEASEFVALDAAGRRRALDRVMFMPFVVLVSMQFKDGDVPKFAWEFAKVPGSSVTYKKTQGDA